MSLETALPTGAMLLGKMIIVPAQGIADAD